MQGARVPSPSPRALDSQAPSPGGQLTRSPHIPPGGVMLSDSPARKSDPMGAHLFPNRANRVRGAHI